MSRVQLTTGIAVVAALVVIAIFFIVQNPFAQSASMNQQQASAASQPSNSGLVVQDEQVGTGAEAKVGSLVSVNYTGKLQDGTVFDSSVNRSPIQFVLGAGKVIPGWEQGIQGMKVGGKRLLIIPPQLGYGPQAMGPIPANSTLIFEVELMDVAPPSAAAATQ